MVVISLLSYLRSKFKAPTARKVLRKGNYLIKAYDDHKEGEYERNVLAEIVNANPITFLVPKVLKVIRSFDQTLLVMEYIKGCQLEDFVLKFLLSKNSEALRIFYLLGRTIRELHTLSLNRLHDSSLPSSCSEIKVEIAKLSKRLATLEILDHKLATIILDTVMKADIDDEVFSNVNLHGELYFTHLLTRNEKFVLFDFHNMCKGPSYYDLAMLSVSLYVSLLLSLFPVRQFTLLINAFLLGYYERSCEDKLLKSVKLAELYLSLREILAEVKNLHGERSSIIRLIALLKIKRLKTIIEKVIIPKLVA